MTLKELEYAYNFHDCYVFTPFEINEDCITVTFDLAKHLQYDPLKSRYGDILQIKDTKILNFGKDYAFNISNEFFH